MNYRSENNKDNLSILGFGCMRFPKKGNGFDMEEIKRELKYSIDNGVNYFDTAYIYPGSEEALGTALLELGLRDKVNIASKLPHYLMKSTQELEKRFEEQLSRLKTDHIDYYLMHMLPDGKTWDSIVERKALDWLKAKQAEGKIRRIGFSYHGNTEVFIDILHKYDWDFCQIQYNYMDENSQAGRAGLNEAYKLGIPVIIMEPLRGGRLANDLPKAAIDAFNSSKNDWSPAKWAFKWLWDQKEVTVVLSGMNSMDMVKENIQVAKETLPGSLTDEERSVYDKVRKAINAKMKVPCTGCRYCMPCPKGVDIPGSFRCLNASYIDGYFTGLREYFMCTSMRDEKGLASQCIECGKCESHCPQAIAIRQELKKVKKRFENPIFKLATIIVGKLK